MDYCLIAATAFSWANLSSWWAIAQMALGLGAVIFVHELGHFLVAKACGVKCEKFYLGFDAFDVKIGRQVIIPRSLLKWTWGDTQYGIGILPLGGYVKMLGQDDNPSNIANESARSQLPHHEPTHEVSAAGLDLEATAVGPIDRTKLDPRSYQAKSVGQRMAIISAGVIMNLIFSVIFATIAFRTGVNYEPPVIGQSMIGGPAFIADLDGAEILKVNGRSTTDSYYTFQHLTEEIILNGAEQPLTFEMRLPGEGGNPGPVVTRKIKPELNINADFPDIPAIGVSPAATTRLGDDGTLPEQAASRAEPPFQAGDLVVEIEGTPVKTLWDMRCAFATIPERAVEVIVERASKKKGSPPERIKITIPPNPMIEFGLGVAIGPVRVIQEGSPAAQAGIRIGDIIETLNGEPVGDPIKLPSRLLEAARTQAPVELGILRSENGSEPRQIKVTVTPRRPKRHNLHGNTLASIDTLGLAVGVTNRVAIVEPDGPAAQAGFEVGDVILGAKFNIGEELKKDPKFRGSEVVEFQPDLVGWTNVFDSAQFIRPPQSIEVRVQRGSQEELLTITPRVSTTWFSASRGILPNLLERTYRAGSWWEAIQLGADRTYKDMGRVLRMLEKLVRGQVAIKHLGGPGTIAVAATSEASQGSSRLLLFLTLLGANLAVLNFLPIPILDGGHMMFLAYEGIFRRPVNERVQIILSFMGLFFIVGLMLLAISLDVFRFLF